MTRQKSSSGGNSTGLTLQLNAVVLLAALIVIAFFITPEPYRIPLVLVMILAGGIPLVHLYQKVSADPALAG